MKWPKLNCIAILAIVALFLMGAAVSAGTIPNTLNYQGTLTDSTGKPVTAPAKSVTFKLYTSALGGTAFWNEQQTMQVNNGQFSVVLGSTVSLPTNKFNGNTYVGVTVESGQEMLPRQKLTSVAYALKAADATPKGVILMWSSANGPIPDGWALCDGNPRTALDGTTLTVPDLQDKFIIGGGKTYAVDTAGGQATHTHTISGVDINHTHNDDHNHMTYGHTLTINEIPSHSHTMPWRDGTGGSNGYQMTQSVTDHSHSTDAAGGGASHDHGATNYKSEQGNGITTGYMNQNNVHTHTENSQPNVPPFYALAFIIKL